MSDLLHDALVRQKGVSRDLAMIDPERRRTYAAAALMATLTLVATYPIILAPE